MKSERKGSLITRSATAAWSQLLKLGFGLLYNQLAWSYDRVSWLVSRGEWRAWQRAALPFLRGKSVLELAHGPGHMLLALDAEGYQAVGLDLSSAMGQLAKRRTVNARHQIALIRGDGQSLPFRQHSFDDVLSTFPTEFMVRPETIDGIFRVLKPGGRLVVVPQAQLTDNSGVARFIEWLYSITGQRLPDSAEERDRFWQMIDGRLRASGFVPSVELVGLEASEVTVLVAEKPLNSTQPLGAPGTGTIDEFH